MEQTTQGDEHKVRNESDLDVDIAVVGAGLAGLAFARFYLETRRHCRLVLLEQASVIGGVWSSDRVFDTFWVQSPLRQSYFSDRPLQLPAGAPIYHDTFAAKYITQYLEEYVDSHSYNGKSLRDLIIFNSSVGAVRKAGDRWTLEVAPHGSNALRHVRCTRLVLANGITSVPVMPTKFLELGCPIKAIHHRDFGAAAEQILAHDSKYEHITVIGGGKSAADMVYAAVKAGKIVNWLVRRTGGEGPGIFLDAPADYPYHGVVEAGNTLHAIALNPSAFRKPGWYARLHHQSEEGLPLLQEKMLAVDRKCKAIAAYRTRPGALPCFKDLEPEASYFWQTGPVGVIQQKDFWEVVSQQVNVFRADIATIEGTMIGLQDGRAIRTDVALCGTGWSTQCSFLTPQQIYELGLPHEPQDDKESQMWNTLMQAADKVILQDYPILSQSAEISERSLHAPLTPARLYRGIAPLSDASVIFLGRPRLANSFRGSEAQAIWATAYLDGKLQQASLDERRWDIAYHNMFSRRRYPTRGGDGLNLHADLILYTDTLVSEAGLTSHRRDWWQDWNAPTLASDFSGCRDEYIRKYGLS